MRAQDRARQRGRRRITHRIRASRLAYGLWTRRNSTYCPTRPEGENLRLAMSGRKAKRIPKTHRFSASLFGWVLLSGIILSGSVRSGPQRIRTRCVRQIRPAPEIASEFRHKRRRRVPSNAGPADVVFPLGPTLSERRRAPRASRSHSQRESGDSLLRFFRRTADTANDNPGRAIAAAEGDTRSYRDSRFRRHPGPRGNGHGCRRRNGGCRTRKSILF